MKMAARKPPTSPTMPPPKAISSEPRSPPASIIWRARRSTLERVLCFSPAGRKSAMGGCGKDFSSCSPQSAQISGEVRTKTRRGSWPTVRSIREPSEASRPLPVWTSYRADGVSTLMVCTLVLWYRMRGAGSAGCPSWSPNARDRGQPQFDNFSWRSL